MFGNPRVGSFVDPTELVSWLVVLTDSVVSVAWLCVCDCMLRENVHDVGYKDKIIQRGSMHLKQ